MDNTTVKTSKLIVELWLLELFSVIFPGKSDLVSRPCTQWTMKQSPVNKELIYNHTITINQQKTQQDSISLPVVPAKMNKRESSLWFLCSCFPLIFNGRSRIDWIPVTYMSDKSPTMWNDVQLSKISNCGISSLKISASSSPNKIFPDVGDFSV